MPPNTPRSKEALLDEAISLADGCLDEIAEIKRYGLLRSDIHSWIFGLLARIKGTGESVRTLLKDRMQPDCHVLTRTMFEAYLDILYLMEGPYSERDLLLMAATELAASAKETLQLHAKYHGEPLATTMAQNPGFAKIASDFDRCMKELNSKGLPRWRNISNKDKRKILTLNPKTEAVIDELVEFCGNVFAHSRPVAVAAYLRPSPQGKFEFFDGRVDANTEEYRKAQARPVLVLQLACGYLIRRYNMDKELVTRHHALRDEFALHKDW